MHTHHSTSSVDPKTLPGYANRWKGFLFIAISLLVISLDNTILNTALPSISRDLNATGSDLQWMIDSYILLFAAMLLTMGAVGDRYGRKLWLQIGLILFGIGSTTAALSESTEMLIVSRGFLGFAAAIIMPATLSLLTATFSKEEHSQVIALWAATFGLGVGIGPVVGGFLLEHYSWHSVFFINLPVIVVAVAGGQYFLAESSDPDSPPIDYPGVVLSIVGLFGLVYGIIEAGAKGWTDTEVLIGFAVGGVGLGLFAWWENRAPNPMLPLYFFKNLSFTGANTALAFIMFSMFGSVFFLSQFLQTVQGYTPLEAGLRMLPLAFTLAFVSASSAKITKRLGIKYSVVLGMAIAATGLLYMSQTYEANWEIIRQSVESAELVSTDQQATLRAAVYPITEEIAIVSPTELVAHFQITDDLILKEEPFTFIWGQLIATLATLEPADSDAPAVQSMMLLARLPDTQTLLVVTLLLQPDAPPELLRDWQDMLILAQLNEVEIDLDSMLLAFGQFPALRLEQ